MSIFKKKPLGKCPRCGFTTRVRWIKLGREIRCENCDFKLQVITKRKQSLEDKKKSLGIVDTIEEAYGISMGIEIETYTIRISAGKYSIGYDDVVYPKEQVFEDGEIFTQDLTIGTEFNSPVFYHLYNAYFRLIMESQIQLFYILVANIGEHLSDYILLEHMHKQFLLQTKHEFLSIQILKRFCIPNLQDIP